MRLTDRVAIITGGGSGIGRATAKLFAQEEARVAVIDLRPERAQSTAEEIEAAGGQALVLEADVSRKEAVDRAVAQVLERWGQADVLVNNAAISSGDDILTFDEETWDLNLRVVLKSVFLCSKAVLPAMIERRRGAIVNIASVNGLTALGEEGYSAAKAGVVNLTENMAIKYGAYNVRANAIAPGTVRTPIWQERVDQDPAIFDRLAKWYPLGRVGEPEDIAQAALFLASDAAAWITGTVLRVDGGLLAGNFRMGRELEGFENS